MVDGGAHEQPSRKTVRQPKNRTHPNLASQDWAADAVAFAQNSSAGHSLWTARSEKVIVSLLSRQKSRNDPMGLFSTCTMTYSLSQCSLWPSIDSSVGLRWEKASRSFEEWNSSSPGTHVSSSKVSRLVKACRKVTEQLAFMCLSRLLDALFCRRFPDDLCRLSPLLG